MNRLRRHLFTFLSLISLLILAACSAAWVSSALTADAWRWYAWDESTRRFEVRELRIDSGWFRVQHSIEIVQPARDATWYRGVNRTIEKFNFAKTLAGPSFQHTTITWPAATWTGGGTESTYTCALWPIVLVSTALPVLRARKWRAARRVRLHRLANHLCQQCGYDLRASPDRCPECGGGVATTGG